MGRKSKAEKAITKLSKVVKQSGYFSVIITSKDNKIIFSNKKITKIELTEIYLRNLKQNIKKHPEYNAEDILSAYKQLWSKYNINSKYTDSYGHIWTKNSFLSDNWLLKYISNILNDSNNNSI